MGPAMPVTRISRIGPHYLNDRSPGLQHTERLSPSPEMRGKAMVTCGLAFVACCGGVAQTMAVTDWVWILQHRCARSLAPSEPQWVTMSPEAGSTDMNATGPCPHGAKGVYGNLDAIAAAPFQAARSVEAERRSGPS